MRYFKVWTPDGQQIVIHAKRFEESCGQLRFYERAGAQHALVIIASGAWSRLVEFTSSESLQ